MTPGAIYNRRWWHRLRRLVLDTGPLCRMCAARGVTTPATEVDHITPISEGGPARDMDNLESLCSSCHSAKTAAERGNRLMRGCDTDGNPLDQRSHWHRT